MLSTSGKPGFSTWSGCSGRKIQITSAPHSSSLHSDLRVWNVPLVSMESTCTAGLAVSPPGILPSPCMWGMLRDRAVPAVPEPWVCYKLLPSSHWEHSTGVAPVGNELQLSTPSTSPPSPKMHLGWHRNSIHPACAAQQRPQRGKGP